MNTRGAPGHDAILALNETEHHTTEKTEHNLCHNKRCYDALWVKRKEKMITSGFEFVHTIFACLNKSERHHEDENYY